MAGLKNQLLTEADINDKITSRANITYAGLIDAILDHKDEKITDDNIVDFVKELDVKEPSLKKYVEAAKKAKFLNDDGSVATKYSKEGGSGKVAQGGKISQSLNKKAKKFRAPKVTNNNLFAEQTFKMLSIMEGQAASSGIKNSLMLTGDPGVGKTSFIRSFAKLLGLPLVTVEAPHITEEHIINIPFMIIKGDKIKRDSATIETAGKHTLEDEAESFEIVQAESNLVTKLKNMRNEKLKTQQHITAVAKDKNLRNIFKNYVRLINQIRSSYHCILFLDEYYRNDNMKIRNILRNILNGRIGNDKIPKGTFIVYASNLDDDGLEDIPMNNDFAEMEFKAPDKEQWFDWFLKKYEDNENKKHPNIKLDHRVYNKFYDVINQTDLSHDDDDVEVRTSPRRWEQLLLYINANLPVSNVKEAKILMSNVEVNFRNYIEGEVSNLYPKIQKVVVELVKETSGVDFDGSTHNQTEWKDVLQQQLATKIKMDADSKDTEGEARKYVPVVSGEPGIGKTAHMGQVADNLDLHFIHIDVATLTRESTTGIPKAAQAVDDDGKPVFDKDGNPVMKTEFSKPELLDLIEKKMQEELDEEAAILPEGERKKGQGKYKFLLLFDELTRADAQVFNSIRKLLLEKSFNESFDLPAEIMVVGALNPEDEGVGELTKHTRDVVDVIPARASWAKTESYLLGQERPSGLEDAMGFDCNSATVGALKTVLSQYQSRDEDWRGNPVAKEERLFNMMEGGNIIYVSPRELTDVVSMTNANILNRLTKVGVASKLNGEVGDEINDMSDDDFIAAMMAQADDKESATADAEIAKGIFNPANRYSEEDFDVFVDAMVVEFRDAWADKLSFTCKKQEIDPANFLSVTTKFIMANQQVRDQYEAIKSLKIETAKSIDEMFNAYYDDPSQLYDSPHFDNYLAANFTAPQKFTQEITDFMADKLVDIEQNTPNGNEQYETPKGEMIERPMLQGKKIGLYNAYLEYVKVILQVLTKKAEHASKVREAERTGQYLGNLYTSLQQIGRDFMTKQGILAFFSKEDTMDKKALDKGRKLAKEIRDLLADFGITPKGR
jgi:hypothetical protein